MIHIISTVIIDSQTIRPCLHGTLTSLLWGSLGNSTVTSAAAAIAYNATGTTKYHIGKDKTNYCKVLQSSSMSEKLSISYIGHTCKNL